MRSWTFLVLAAAVTAASGEKLGNIEVITRDELGLEPPAGGSNLGLSLPNPVQNDVPPPLSYLPPVQTPLPIEPTPVPLPTPIQPQTDYLPPVAAPVGQPEIETPTGLYNPPTAPAPDTNFPIGTGGGVSGAFQSKGAGFSSVQQQGSGGSYGGSYGSSYDTNYGSPRPVGRPYPSEPYPIYPPYPQPQPVYPVPVYPVYRPKPNPFAAFKAKVDRIVQAKKLAAALKHAAYKQRIEEKYQPTYPTYPSYPTYPTYPTYQTYPVHSTHGHGGEQKGKIFGFHKFGAPQYGYHGGW
ncbi:adhesive plaque matrix protein-like [Penaeus japonicus]|uniref:adhesive plaque matrix protein-like n=1 Tax=Penaeus japonicus TaxID=27405 RepID=UPI001C713E39|nr:adhesive plaque matrix protein-like [Penaeus japonicus]